jgi:hypothetical protein
VHKESSPLPSDPRLDRRVLQIITAQVCAPSATYLAYLRQVTSSLAFAGSNAGGSRPNREVSGLEDEDLNAGGTPKLVDTIGTMGQLGLLPPLG